MPKLFQKYSTIFILFINFLSAEIIIDNDMKKNDNFLLEYYHDEAQEMNISTIQKVKFSTTNNKFSFGYISGDSWFKLTIDNRSDKSDFILYFTEAFHKSINLFEYHQNTWTKEKSGILEYIKHGDIKDINPTFTLHIKPQTSKIFYIQIHSKAKGKVTTFGEFILYTQKAFSFNIVNENFIYLFYFGSMFIIIILNIFIFIIFRDPIFIYYVLYVIFNNIFVLSYSGLNSYIGLAQWNDYLDISVVIFPIFFALFSMSFLNTRKYLPKIDKVLRFTMFILLIFIPFIIIDYTIWFNFTIKIITIFSPILLFSSIYLLFKGNLEVKYYVLAIIVFISSLMTLSFMTEGVIPNNDYNHYIFIFASYFEIIFFFFILINRFYKINRELMIIKDKNEYILEAKIEARTEEISKLLGEKELLLKEIYHRVKNNFQMVIGLLWIETSKEISKEHKNSFIDIINRIKSMSLIHSYLLESKDISEIDSQEYLTQIIKQTKNIYTAKELLLEEDIDLCYLSINEALSLGIIINEVLNNAVKHYNKVDKCQIKLSLKVSNNNIKLLIKDNGVGYIANPNSNGFGLKMLEEFAKNLESSKIEFIINNGTEFILDFKYSK